MQLTVFIIGILLFKKGWATPYKLLILFTGIASIIDMAVRFGWSFEHYPVYWAYNIFLFVQCILLLTILYLSFYTRMCKRSVAILIAACIATTAACFIEHPSITTFNHHAANIDFIILFLSSMLFFIDALSNDVMVYMYEQPMFWFSTGIAFYSMLHLIQHVWGLTFTIPMPEGISNYTFLICDGFLFTGIVATFICQYRVNKR
jgi:hypothetical protein